MESINKVVHKENAARPEKILQFGTGNFLRAFADWMIDRANKQGLYNGSVVISQVTPHGGADRIIKQDGLYTVVLRGIVNGEAVEQSEVITSISRCINPYADYESLLDMARSPELEVVISNTTEAGIAYHAGDKLSDRPAASFPAKVCAFLYERYKTFDGAADKGLLFLPVELIDNNGAELKRIVLQYASEWGLEDKFITWVTEANHFCSTLVDRIVPGFPKDQIDYFREKLGYEDNCLVAAEPFNLWVIEGKKEWADILPVHKTDANVIWTENVAPYKKRKVRILNGGHTGAALAAYLGGHNTVLEMMQDEVFERYIDKLLYDEVIPTLDLPHDELMSFAAEVKDRFCNPYVKHQLLDISLNSCSKWAVRVMPSLLGYIEANGGRLPAALTFSLAAFIDFYRGEMVDGAYTGRRSDGTSYPIRDNEDVLKFFCDTWNSGLGTAEISERILSNASLWNGHNLAEIPGLKDAVAGHLEALKTKSVQDVIKTIL